MDTIQITITETGDVRCLVSLETAPFISPDAVIRRASHVEPIAIAARVAFYALRALFGEYGRMAEFTRRWRCLWRVNLSPIGGGILPGTWRDRSEAISAEIAHLNETFI